MRRKIIIYLVSLVILFFVLLLAGCSKEQQEYRYNNNRTTVEENTTKFDPAYFKDSEKKHIALFFDITENRLEQSDFEPEVRPGKLPYRRESTGNVLVIYKASDGKELGRYSIEDPIIARSCDSKDLEGGEVKLLTDITVEVLIPYNLDIASVNIGPELKKLIEFDITSQMKYIRGKK